MAIIRARLRAIAVSGSRWKPEQMTEKYESPGFPVNSQSIDQPRLACGARVHASFACGTTRESETSFAHPVQFERGTAAIRCPDCYRQSTLESPGFKASRGFRGGFR